MHRKVIDNPIVCKDSDYFAVWMYLLLNATHKDVQVIFNGKKTILHPGQLITGRKKIALKFGLSESKVRRILNELENDQQIDRQISTKNTLITIVNWDIYQNSDQQNDQQVTNKRPTSDQQVTTNKNEKKEKNDKNEKNIELRASAPPTLENVTEYCRECGLEDKVDASRFIDFYSSKGWMVGKNKMKDWKASVRNWARRSDVNNAANVTKNQFTNFSQTKMDKELDILDQLFSDEVNNK